jgi:hypothetical protein
MVLLPGDEFPTDEIKSPVNRKPGILVRLWKRDSYIELPEFGPPFIIGQVVLALPFSQEGRVEPPHSLRPLQGVPSLVGGWFLRASPINLTPRIDYQSLTRRWLNSILANVRSIFVEGPPNCGQELPV